MSTPAIQMAMQVLEAGPPRPGPWAARSLTLQPPQFHSTGKLRLTATRASTAGGRGRRRRLSAERGAVRGRDVRAGAVAGVSPPHPRLDSLCPQRGGCISSSSPPPDGPHPPQTIQGSDGSSIEYRRMCQKDGRWGSWTNGAALWERSRLEQVRGSTPRAHSAAGVVQDTPGMTDASRSTLSDLNRFRARRWGAWTKHGATRRRLSSLHGLASASAPRSCAPSQVVPRSASMGSSCSYGSPQLLQLWFTVATCRLRDLGLQCGGGTHRRSTHAGLDA